MEKITRRCPLAARLASGLALAASLSGCSTSSLPGGAGGNGTGGNGADSDGGDNSGSDCEALVAEQLAVIQAHRSCAVDDDCQRLETFCVNEAKTDCSGNIAVNLSIDQEAFVEREIAIANVCSEDICGTCLTGWSKPPICIDGTCEPDPTDPWPPK